MDYTQRLNRDVDRTRTSARYDQAAGGWVHDVVLLGPNGQPISVVDNKVAVRAADIEAILGQVSANPMANTLADRLKQIADRLGEVSANPTANTALARLKVLEGYLDGVEGALGAQADGAQTNPANAASIVALLKGLLKQLQGTGSGEAPVKLTGSSITEAQALPTKDTQRISAAPVVGAKTVTTTAAELFAGGARLANRVAMTVYNESSIPVYWGPAGVTTSSGFPLLPGDAITFPFRPSTAVPIYFIASANAAVRVVEVA